MDKQLLEQENKELKEEIKGLRELLENEEILELEGYVNIEFIEALRSNKDFWVTEEGNDGDVLMLDIIKEIRSRSSTCETVCHG